MTIPPSSERPILERFLKAEAMALWAVRAAQLRDVPANVLAFLKQHEADEEEHLKHFETLVGYQSWGREVLPTVPHQWPSLAVLLFGYEALGLEFAKLLVGLRPDMQSIVDDEETHVAFFEQEIRKLLVGGGVEADQARISAKAWWKKLPRTVDRYLQDSSLDACRTEVASAMQAAIHQRLKSTGLLE
ncbi:hypothetical protein [Nitrospira lenta]|uniref:Ferritin-like domain-containing protein n=1 Tax=Nitrospira lenta TaxID=1436998 RepID=A0A330LBE6_9BACT|nr:hypothetical protein [Nitrospira lenta]SPP66416.1 conserved hypothetical protein [Nitrospira lenta]